MLRQLLLVLSLFILFSSCHKDFSEENSVVKTNVKSDSISIGSIHTITSKILGENREIIISLPDDYTKSNSNYPVLYLTDGFQNIEHVRGSVEILTRTGNIPPIIIVGVKSINRVRDFTFTHNKNKLKSGGGKQFLTFLETELIPYIDKTYRTNAFQILEGHSLGGLFTASTLIEKPELFQGFIIMSPALWWNNEELTQKAKTFFTTNPNLEKSLFFGIGKEESSKEFGMRKELTNFIDVINTNKPKKLNFEHKEFDNEGHMSSPLLSNYYGLKSIFADLKYSDSFIKNYSNDEFLKKEKEIINKYGESAKRTGESYYELGASIYNENLSGAITIFKRSIEVYPYDINLITTLARLYEKNNDTSNAIDTYKYAIEVSEKYNFDNEESYQKEIDRLKSN
jgi:predicted alpha/beta superfamily hydrolase